ncbi:MAG: endonuclease [Aureispira sp.]
MRQNLYILLLLIAPLLQAQYQHQAVFPTYSGSTLLDSLIIRYKPITTLLYDEARDTLYALIYRHQDSVECVYTGHKLRLPLGVDPSTSLYRGGTSNGINAEHTYPQSKGARYGNAKSDMHHLYPTRTGVNSARSNCPLLTIDAASTTSWYYRTLVEVIPSLNSALYSKKDISAFAFEPRKSHQGNAARAIFYFYTMYKTEADAADPSFFAQQLPSLCQWHVDDPVDQLEWERTFKIATYQDGKVNPFVLDCTLPQRSYCPHLPLSTCYSSLPTLADLGTTLYEAYPNPAVHHITIAYELERPSYTHLTIFNSWGQVVWRQDQTAVIGLQETLVPCQNWSSGVYHYQLTIKQGNQQVQVGHSFIKGKT